jgi:hypothetical protein
MKYKYGKDHPNWKGDNVGYEALHEWVRKNLPRPELCKRCNKNKSREVSNNGTYDRNLDSWEWLCRSCHIRKDGRDHAKEKNGAAKLTEKQVEEIRNKYDGKWGSLTRLGKEYGVAGWTISQIISHKIW